MYVTTNKDIRHTCTSFVPGPSNTANAVEGLVKLLRRKMSGRRLEAWHFGFLSSRALQ